LIKKKNNYTRVKGIGTAGYYFVGRATVMWQYEVDAVRVFGLGDLKNWLSRGVVAELPGSGKDKLL
jgi:hypothetical protein